MDRKFKQFLREIFCRGVWDEYEINYPSEVQKMLYDFSVLKRKDEDVLITCPFNLGTLAQQITNVEKFFESVEGASWNDGSFKISKGKLRSFFDHSLNGIRKSLSEILKKDLNISYILLVGGYAESQILRQHIINHFGKYQVLCPFRAQEAIVKGAVMFGRNPAVVASRKSAFTYGFAINERFDQAKHREDKKFINKEGEWCRDIFRKLVQIDEDVGWNETRQHNLYPIEADQKRMRFTFYRTERENSTYVDEWGLDNIGQFVVNMPDITRGMNRRVRLEVKFGFTEITATATDIDSGSVESIELDFMTKS